jgi:hypothetical protein
MPEERYRLYHAEKARGGIALTITAGSGLGPNDADHLSGPVRQSEHWRLAAETRPALAPEPDVVPVDLMNQFGHEQRERGQGPPSLNFTAAETISTLESTSPTTLIEPWLGGRVLSVPPPNPQICE